jgi:polyisoprenoid-binding protein YceI
MVRARVGGGWVVLAWLSVHAAAGVMQAPEVFTIDAANSRVLIRVGRAGVLAFAGHVHEVLAPVLKGRVSVEPGDPQRSSVSLEFDASALRVSGEGEPPADVPQVQEVMLSERVLDVKHFPAVAFQSRRVSARPGTRDHFELTIEGDLTLHGVTRPLIIHANTAFEPNGLSARGTFVITQSDFGIRPVTAAGGTVKVRDEVDVEFLLRARRSEAR